jgi:hypothetical protein
MFGVGSRGNHGSRVGFSIRKGKVREDGVNIQRLRERDGACCLVMSDFDAEQPADVAEVSERELVIELALVGGDELARASSYRAVINMCCKDE